MDLLEQVDRFIRRHDMPMADGRVLAGVSGGVDSVVLLHVLHRLGLPLAVAHVNYGLRGSDADADEALVRTHCERLGVPLFTARYDTKALARSRGISVQETARDLRYAFFGEVAEREGCTAVAVAHHRDDQIETVLLNLFRGAGLEGLAGMPVARPLEGQPSVTVIRPLLRLRRKEIVQYAEANGLRWREDVTNSSPEYSRSAVRTAILPVIEAHFGTGADEQIARAGDLLREYVDDWLRPEIRRAWEACARDGAGGGTLNLKAMADYTPVLQKRLILEALSRWMPDAPYSAATAEAVHGLQEAQAGRRCEVGAGAVYRDREALVFVPHRHAGADLPPDARGFSLGEPVRTPKGVLTSEILAETPARLDIGAPLACYVDADRLAQPLSLRAWKSGDRFRPLGMRRTKKVSDFLTDSKAPAAERKNALVLCAGGEIVWVVGYRMGDAVKVTPATRRIAAFTFAPA